MYTYKLLSPISLSKSNSTKHLIISVAVSPDDKWSPYFPKLLHNHDSVIRAVSNYRRITMDCGSITNSREKEKRISAFSLKFSLASMAQTAREVRNTLRNCNKTTVWLEREPQSGSNTRRSRSHLRQKKREKHISPIAWPGCSGRLRSSLRMHACTLRTRTRTCGVSLRFTVASFFFRVLRRFTRFL